VAQQDLGVTVDPAKIDPAALKIMNLKSGNGFFVPTPNITDPGAAKHISKLYIPAVQPGTFGVPGCATVSGSQVCDTYETTFAATGRNAFRGPFQPRFDLALLKHTRLTERFGLDFRADALNIFNHPDFDVPSNSTSLYRRDPIGQLNHEGYSARSVRNIRTAPADDRKPTDAAALVASEFLDRSLTVGLGSGSQIPRGRGTKRSQDTQSER
jgi:hypothetical protein